MINPDIMIPLWFTLLGMFIAYGVGLWVAEKQAIKEFKEKETDLIEKYLIWISKNYDIHNGEIYKRASHEPLEEDL